jgi:Fe-S-cluster-containing hydrogenase component 2
VRKIDSCIECYACETACEDRYGAKRLSLNGRVLGGLDFVDACHTCTDQRCIDPCNFDAISFDVQRKEVLIKEDACTGCTLCAVACPYDAIEMHELDDKPHLRLRLDKAGMLKHGEGAARKAKLRRIASKCDHCAFYEDQACISACPTGALVEVLPQDVITQLPDQARATAKAGFDRTAPINVNQLNQTQAFVKGLQIPELGRARAPRTKLLIGMWWTIGLLAVALSGVEILLRKLFPGWSASYWLAVHVDGLDPDLALTRVDFRPGCELAVNYGYTGTFIMVSGLFYVWRRRLGFMRNWGSLRAWFDWHVMTGVVGPTFILYHSAAKLDNWVSLAFWSMVLTVISGLLGRYLTTELPERASTAMVETLEVDRKLAELRSAHPGVRVADGWFENYRRRVANWDRKLAGTKGQKAAQKAAMKAAGQESKKKPTFLGAVATFLWVVKDDVLKGRRRRALKKALRAAVRGKGSRKVRREAIRYAERLAVLERRRVLMPRLEPLFTQWRAVHVPMSVTLTIIAGIHIYLALRS